jgi:glycine cleavage system T protein
MAKRHTPLYDWHVANGAKMVDFAGWEMPVQYADGAIAEHRLVRRSAGLFDISHMGRVEIVGRDATRFLDYVLTNDMAGCPVGQSIYGLLCKEDGGVLDDVFSYRLEDDHWLLVVNAANRDKDLAWLEEHAAKFTADIVDRSEDVSMIAFQGPKAVEIMDALSNGTAGKIPRFGVAELELPSGKAVTSRTGYTGEDGVEIYPDAPDVQSLWEDMLAAGREAGMEIGPCGLAARDSLRFEPGFALYGHELSEEITPIEARLKWACKLEKEFIGAEVLRRQAEEGTTRKLATFSMTERGVPREGYPVYVGDEQVGEVVTGMYAPTADSYSGNAFIRAPYHKRGTKIEIEIRGRRRAAEVVRRPLYKPSYREGA